MSTWSRFFFASGASRTAEQEFLAAVVPQLAFILDELTPVTLDRHTFRSFWDRAAERAETQDRHLLLVVDGLDEDSYSTGTTVAGLLPGHLWPRAHVVVASRPFPGMPAQSRLPGDVAPDHPLHAAAANPVELMPVAAAPLAARALSDPEPFGGLLEGLNFVESQVTEGLQSFLAEYVDQRGTTVAFGGRHDNLRSLTTWLSDSTMPYALLVAPAGRGKSALLARWSVQIAAGGADVAFVPVSVRFRTASEAQTIPLLGARLRHLTERRGPLPPNLHAWVPEVHAALKEDRFSGRPLIIVLDGVDEAVGWDPADLLSFPRTPGRGVKVLISAWELADRDIESWQRVLGWKDPVRRVQLPPLDPRRGRGSTAFVGWGSSADIAGRPDMLGEIVRLSEGDPLLVRLYAAWLGESGAALAIDALPDLPPGLDGYFKQWERDLDRHWGAEKPLRQPQVRAVLGVLATALGPVLVDDVLVVAGDHFADGIAVDTAVEPLARFVVGDGRKQGWIFSHPRLAQHFREQLGEGGTARWAERWVSCGRSSARSFRVVVARLRRCPPIGSVRTRATCSQRPRPSSRLTRWRHPLG